MDYLMGIFEACIWVRMATHLIQYSMYLQKVLKVSFNNNFSLFFLKQTFTVFVFNLFFAQTGHSVFWKCNKIKITEVTRVFISFLLIFSENVLYRRSSRCCKLYEFEFFNKKNSPSSALKQQGNLKTYKLVHSWLASYGQFTFQHLLTLLSVKQM